jgi:ATP-dependent exoDNAse (exonuclease V) alpha subunit
MAIFHFSAQVISRSNGGNAVQAAAYRAGLRLACARTGLVFNFVRKTEVAHRAILAPREAPSWVFDRLALWNRAEASESRTNSQLAREVELALPVELTQSQQVALLHGYVQEQFVSQGMVADIALHAKTGNPHAHILLTLRDAKADGFGAKRRDWNNPTLVQTWREAWAKTCNVALAESGHAERIDHRSHKARGIALPATVHQGRRTPANAERWEARAEFNAWVQTQVELAKVRAQAERVQLQVLDLTSTLAEALAERDAQRAVSASSLPSVPTVPRVWTSTGEVRARDFSVPGLLAWRTSADPGSGARRNHRSSPPPEVSHDSGGFTQGEKPC